MKHLEMDVADAITEHYYPGFQENNVTGVVVRKTIANHTFYLNQRMAKELIKTCLMMQQFFKTSKR